MQTTTNIILDYLVVVGLVLKERTYHERILLKMVQILQKQLGQDLLNRVQPSLQVGERHVLCTATCKQID